MPKFYFQTSEKEQARAEAEQEYEYHLEEMARRYAPSGAVHENLRQFRTVRSLKKQEVAALMEVTTRTYYDYEEGNRPIPSDALVRLAVLTGGDLNEILLGRPAETRPKTIEIAINDFCTILRFLAAEYSSMDMSTRAEVARFALTHDWQGMPRVHPEVIRDAVKMTTRYRFHPETIPAPPYWEDYEDQAQYEADMAQWQREVDEDLGPPPDEAKE
ncbi:helix-turn-helix domain-containing protein [Gymnodinialimonas ulvae]|uniref:helix-turn-helix domain-containing protein n=1 Tax=Gymnodinialimonas ulvae TaxID=3126504 RepID=UPI003094DED0